MTAGLFRFLQFEVPFALGPPDGRWLIRSRDSGEAQRVIVLRTIGARRSDASSRRRRATKVAPVGNDAVTVPITRATIIDAGAVESEGDAHAWLASLDPRAAAEDAIDTLNRLLAAQRIAASDPRCRLLNLADALVVRAGFGEGEHVADGLWREAISLPPPHIGGRERRIESKKQAYVHERIAAQLRGELRPLLCEELALRARLDLDQGRPRLAAIELERCLAVAARELRLSRAAIWNRLRDLNDVRPPVEAIASAVLAGEPMHREQVLELERALSRFEAALLANPPIGPEPFDEEA